MIVVKFGGSSLAGPQRMLNAARIVKRHSEMEPVICVVSAMAGVTDHLIEIAALAARGLSDCGAPFEALRNQHEHTQSSLATTPVKRLELAPLWRALKKDAATLSAAPDGYARDEAVAVFSAWGERLSVCLFASALVQVGLDAAPFEDAPVIMERDACSATSRWAASVVATGLWLGDPVTHLIRWGKTPVLPGYLALTQDGHYTTLGRNGSDQSAAIIASSLAARAVYIYSDVAGIYEADPRIIPDARLLTALTYDEAAAVVAYGARVLHPAALPPLARRGIPLHLRSAFNPDAPGTDIGPPSAPFTASLPVGVTPLSTLFTSLALAGARVKIGRPDAY